uniref:DUF4408 domain-containing protein n=1 Tax=Oryza punctata TaxID=4537 RepID=A0A0E0L553_ORYPU
MDGADAAASGMGAWASIRGYFTPATLFLVVNIVIGTIALTSRTHQRRRRQVYEHHHDGEMLHRQQLQPTPPLHQQQEYGYGGQYYGGGEQQQMIMQEALYAPPPAPAPLARTSSVLDRLRSFGLYRFRSGDFPPEYATAAAVAAAATSHQHHHHTEELVSSSPVDEVKQQAHYARSRSEPAPSPALAQEERKSASRLRNSSSEVSRAEVVRAPARVVEAFQEEAAVDATAGEFIDNFTPKQRDLPHQQEYVPPPAPAPAPLARTSSFLDRLRSFSLYRFRSGDLATDDIPADAAAAAATPAQAHYGRTRSEPAREQNKKAKKQAASEAKTMTKSSSEARKEPAAEDADDGGVDARADDFINRFRQQLQLQRLNSLLNYKEMLNRGSS